MSVFRQKIDKKKGSASQMRKKIRTQNDRNKIYPQRREIF